MVYLIRSSLFQVLARDKGEPRLVLDVEILAPTRNFPAGSFSKKFREKSSQRFLRGESFFKLIGSVVRCGRINGCLSLKIGYFRAVDSVPIGSSSRLLFHPVCKQVKLPIQARSSFRDDIESLRALDLDRA